MSDREYHQERERQCREMAAKAAQENVRAAHISLADLHHQLADEDDVDERAEDTEREVH